MHTGHGDSPIEKIDLDLCRIYHCPPSVLDEQDWLRIQGHLTVLSAESFVAKHKAKAAKNRR